MIDIQGYTQIEEDLDATELCHQPTSSDGIGFEGGGPSNGNTLHVSSVRDGRTFTSGRGQEPVYSSVYI